MTDAAPLIDLDDRQALMRGRLLIITAAVLWSISGVATKLIDLDPLAIAFYRSLFGGLALLPLTARGHRKLQPSMLPLWLVFGAMTGVYIASVKLTSAANAIFLQCGATVWLVPIGYWFLKEKTSTRGLISTAIAGVGVVIIVTMGYDPRRPGEFLGILLGLASGIAYAIVVASFRWFRQLDSTWLSATNNIGGSLVIATVILVTKGTIPIPPWPVLLGLIAFGIVQMAIPYAIFARGLKTLPAAEAGLLGLLEPILNPIWVLLFVGERPLDATLCGGAIFVAAVAFRYLPFVRFDTKQQ